jgi:hypothetical protein
MPDFYKGIIPIVRRNLNEAFLRAAPGSLATGCVPRDYDLDPVEMRDSPAGMALIDESEYDARYDEAEKTESSLEHLFLRGGRPAFEFLDQNGHGYCWAYSTGHCLMLDRLKQNLPVARINPHATAAIIKRGRDEGGWSGLSMKFAREHGYALEGTGPGLWPLHSRDLRHDTPALRASMADHRAEESWYDFGRGEWDQRLSKRQLATCSFNNVPCATDWNRFGHAMCQLRYVRIERGHWGWLTLNSWAKFGYRGLCVLADMNPDGAVGLRSSTPSARLSRAA